MADLLFAQVELQKQLDKALKNFKKTPKSRLTESYTQVKLELLENLWKCFKQNHMTLIKKTDLNLAETDYTKKDVFDLTEEVYTTAKCEMMEILKTFTATDAGLCVNTQQTSPSKSTSMTPEIKLPRINIPVFSGKYADWIPFHDLFLSLIHRNPALMNVQKLHYLKSSLSGEAETLLRHIPLSEANYDDAWAALKKRYNNRRFIVTSILKRLLSQKSISTESAGSIKNLLDTTNECLSGLQNVGIFTSSWDAILVHITVTKLDPESIRLWEQQISRDDDGESLPTFKQLTEYLESRFRTIEMLESARTISRPSTKQNTFHTTFKTSCKYCQGNHFIYQCKDFAHQTYTDRKHFVEKNKLCYNCLIPFHTVQKCKQRTTCRRCGKRHHSLIHPENNALDQLSSDAGRSSQIRDTQPEVAETPVNNNVAAHYADKELTKDVLLATALVKIQASNGTTHLMRALIDPGSEGSFITESAAQFLGLKKTTIRCKINGLGDKDSRSLISNSMVTFDAHSKHDSSFSIPMQAYVLKTITRLLPTKQIHKQNWPHLQNLELADPYYDTPGRIDILLNAEIYGEILKDGLRKGPRGTLIAQNTYLGWILLGQLHNQKTSQGYTTTISMHLTIEENKLLQRFWEIESEATPKIVLTEEESRCEQFYAETHTRDKDGRYIVSLPFKEADPPCKYGSSRNISEGRLLQLEKRFARDTKFEEQYRSVLKDYLISDYMEEIINENDRNNATAVYIPHHAVANPKKTTVRVVMDASCKYRNGSSLNDSLMVGPRLQPDLRHIILRWRCHRICLVADITKMYLQIKVDPTSSDFQRLLWRNNSTEEIKDFRMTRVTFGTTSAPYLATKTLQQLALDEAIKYPLASKITQTDFYMDDLLTGTGTVEESNQIYDEMTALLASGGFQLQKWNSNDPNVLRHMKIPENAVTNLELKLEDTIKTLGIVWNKSRDEFQYSVDIAEEVTYPITKRSIARDVAKLFDPMGWLAPTIVIGKCFLQRLWLTGIAWDQEVPDEIRHDWLKFRAELSCLSNITIPRWLHTTETDSKLELYGFSDASTVAYGAVVYARVSTNTEYHKHVHLISAKTKVAPVKTVSLPRLELCGAVLLTRLLNEISGQLNVSKEDIYAHTDSQVVLSWLQSHPSKWKTFVANRSSEIIASLPSQHWYYVPSRENPADLASRGVSASKLKDETLWWKGPEWLERGTIEHVIARANTEEAEVERRPVKVLNIQIEDDFSQVFTRWSTLMKLLRVIATCKRFRYIKTKNYPKHITAEELDTALTICIFICQKDIFSDEIHRLKENKPVRKVSKLRSLTPFCDEKGLLRVGGRLRHANIPEETKHQIIMPGYHPLTKLIIAEAHKKTSHGVPTLIYLRYLRQKYWIIGGKEMIKRAVHQCVTCVRYRAKVTSQLMADLPKQRVTPAKPFLHTGVDFAGPIDLRMSKGRGCKTYKGYLCIFVCMATKAIHIEIVSSLECIEFVAAFKRFTARRGHCSDVWSDNATNFIAGNKELKALFGEQLNTVKSEILDLLAKDGTEWHNIPASAPHFGGLWEAGVRSIKFHLRRILGNATLTYEEMSTTTSQIEACLNSRPISPISDNVDDLLPLTLGHFLIGEAPIVVPERSYLDDRENRLTRWQLVQKMVQHFWDRWAREYLSRLQQRPKWTQRQNNELKIGDLVILKEDNLPPGKWSLARILSTHPGNDGLVRVVTLRCRNSVIRRPLTKVCPLPIDY